MYKKIYRTTKYEKYHIVYFTVKKALSMVFSEKRNSFYRFLLHDLYYIYGY